MAAAARAPKNATTSALVDPTADTPDPEVQKAVAEHPESVVSPETVVGEPPVAKTEPAVPAYVAPVDEATGRPLPEHQLTPEQAKIRALEDQLARADATRLEKREDVFDEAVAESPEDSILIHFLTDGFIAQGRTWYRGQEIEFVRGSAAHQQTFNKVTGKSWVDLATPAGEMEQAKRWGQIKFRQGPWPGTTYDETEALAAERKRNRAAPVMSTR